MEYQINKLYPMSELHNIEEWWKTHTQYDVNCTLTAVQIVPKDPKVYAERQIEVLKDQLIETDYVANKLSEALAIAQVTNDKTELNKVYSKYSKIISDRQNWRKQISEYEDILNK